MTERCRSCGGKGYVVFDERTGETCGRCEGTKNEPTYQVFADGSSYKVLNGVVRETHADDVPPY